MGAPTAITEITATPSGRKPTGERSLSGAELQARYRTRH